MANAESAHDAVPTLVRWAEDRPLVRAVLLTSTRAVPGAYTDALSDYDTILIVRDLAPFVEDRTWLEDFGETLVVYWDRVYPDPDYGIDCCGNVTQYVDGLKIDFSLWPVELLRRIVEAPALPDELDAGYRVLLDKDRLTDGLQPPTYAAYVPKPPSQAEYQTWVNDFLTDAPYVAKCLRRDELLPAKWCLDHDMKHVYLRQMLEWHVGIDYAWSVPLGSLGKGLKRRLPADLWAQVEQSYAGADLMDNWEALSRTLDVFRRAAIKVGASLGYPYPEDLHRRVTTYVDRLRHIEL